MERDVGCVEEPTAQAGKAFENEPEANWFRRRYFPHLPHLVWLLPIGWKAFKAFIWCHMSLWQLNVHHQLKLHRPRVVLWHHAVRYYYRWTMGERQAGTTTKSRTISTSCFISIAKLETTGVFSIITTIYAFVYFYTLAKCCDRIQ